MTLDSGTTGRRKPYQGHDGDAQANDTLHCKVDDELRCSQEIDDASVISRTHLSLERDEHTGDSNWYAKTSRTCATGPSKQKQQPHALLHWTDIPKWQSPDLSYVQTGYRDSTPTFVACLRSCLYLHNESVNIYSHAFGAAAFIMIPIVLYHVLIERYPTASLADVIVLTTYPMGVAICFILSAIFHILISHSAMGFVFGRQLDFQGIIILIWSASVPMVYYTFHGESGLQKTYWCMTTCFAVLTSISTFSSHFRHPGMRLLRAGMFGLLALATLGSVIHGLIEHGWEHQSQKFPMWTVGVTALFNTIGATAYVIRFPERWWPRRFDIFGASHQLMHCAIVVAGIAWLAGTVIAFDHVHTLRSIS